MAAKKNGKKRRAYTMEEKEKAMALYAANGNLSETARIIGIPKTTIKSWTDKPENNERFEQMRTEKKEQFINQAWEIIDKGLLLTKNRLSRAIEHESELDEIIGIIAKDGELSGQAKTALINKIRALEIQNVRELSTLVGTLYDKQALASGDSTANTAVRVELSGEVAEWAK